MFGLWPRITVNFAEEFFLSLMSNWSREPGLQKSCLNNCHLKIRSAFNNPNRITKRKDYVTPGFLRKLSVYYVDFSHAVVFLSLVTKNHRTSYEASQKERNKYHILRHIYIESRKMIQMILFAKQEQRHRLREQMQGYHGGKVVGWDELGDWD